MAPPALLCLLLAGAAAAAGAVPDEAWLEKASADLVAQPSPAPAVQELLLRRYARTRDPRALAQAVRSLKETAARGTPLEDAELVPVRLDAYQAGKDLELARAAREELDSALKSRSRAGKAAPGWGGLAVTAFARGYQVLEEKSYLEAAVRTARSLRRKVRDPKARAYLAQGLLDLYEASFDPDWLDGALELSRGIEGAAPDAEAAPVQARNLARLALFFGRPDLKASAERRLSKPPEASAPVPDRARWLGALGALLSRPREIVIAGGLDDPGTRELLRAVRAHYLPDAVLMVVPPGPVQKRLASRIPAVKGMVPIGGKPTAYVCIDFACELPSSDARAVDEMLDGKGVGGAFRRRFP